MKIGILGAGRVGGVLARAFARRGRHVMIANSDPKGEKLRALIDEIDGEVAAGSNAEVAAFADVLVLAVGWAQTEAALRDCGDLSGKILLDATNPLKPDLSGLEIGCDWSGGEQVQAWARGARVVKCLNQIGAPLMDGPRLAAGAPVMFMAGDDAEAKAAVAGLVSQLGFQVEDAGGLDAARVLEPLGMLWIRRAFSGAGPTFGFVLSQQA